MKFSEFSNQYRYDKVSNIADNELEISILGSGSPKVLLMAGIHGDELTGIVALEQLRNEINPKYLSGTVCIISKVNCNAVDQQARGHDDQDLNRSFPPKRLCITKSDMLVSWLANIFQKVDIIIDFHSGNPAMYNFPHFRIDFELNPESVNIARYSWIPIINSQQIETSIRWFGAQLGKPVLTFEAGQGLVIDDYSVETAKTVTKDILFGLGILKNYIPTNITQPVLNNSIDILSPVSGKFVLNHIIKDKHIVRKGQPIAGIRGTIIYSPIDGFVLGYNTKDRVSRNDFVCEIGF